MKLTLNELKQKMEEAKYIADDSILIPLFLALKLQKPLLITGCLLYTSDAADEL